MLPLDGVRVLDFSQLLPGAHCSMVLADFGADVVKVEAPPTGDGIRRASPVTPEGLSGRHQVLNRGKRSILLDLKKDADRQVALALAAEADVILESFRAGTMARLGLGYEDLTIINPDLIYVSLTGYGQDGQRAAEPSHDINFLALAGMLEKTPGSGNAPSIPRLQVGDLGGGSLQAVIAVLLALRMRESSGRGQHIDVSMFEGLMSLLSAQMGDHHAAQISNEKDSGRLHGDYACYGLYECADGLWVAVGALEQKFWSALVTAIGEPELAANHLDPGRQPILRARLEEFFGGQTRAQALNALNGTTICVSPVRSREEALRDPGLRDRGFLIEMTDSEGRPMTQPRPTPQLRVGTGRPGNPPDALDGSGKHLREHGWG